MSKTKNDGKSVKITTPSRFGSHASMVVEYPAPEGMVALKDEFGIYFTSPKRLDDGLADPNRYSATRIKLQVEETKKDSK